MKIVISLMAAFLLGPACVFAQGSPPATAAQASFGPPPSDASIRRLLDVTDVKNLLETVKTQYGAMAAGMVKEMTKGRQVSPAEQARLDKFVTAVNNMESEILSWQRMEKLYLNIYKKTFNQAEVDGMIAFYSSPSGQAVVHKLPLVTQNVMLEMQHMISNDMLPQLQKMAEDLQSDLEKDSK